MLQYLRIQNLALMDLAELEFEPGFTAVTGETGAGKSVLLGALSLLSGARADKTIIRAGEDACTVEAALFFKDAQRINTFLNNKALPACEEGILVLRREIRKTKAQRIYINGTLNTLSNLQELGHFWIDFHGPGEPQKLFHEKHQLSMLDDFAQLKKELNKYQEDYKSWKDALKKIDTIRNQDRLDPDAIEFLKAQIEAIEVLSPTEESILQLEQDFNKLSNAQEICSTCSEIEGSLTSESGIISQLQEISKQAQHYAKLDNKVGLGLQQRIESLIIEALDISEEYAQQGTSIDLSAEATEKLESQMAQWQSLKRKYGPDTKAISGHLIKLQEQLLLQDDIDNILGREIHEAAQQEDQLKIRAKAITQKRIHAAQSLSHQAQKLLSSLGFKKAQLNIQIRAEDKLTEQGDSSCRILFAPNAGQELMPLNKIASSGETARVMLALKAILAQTDATPLLIFDEVDANVGGEVGAQVGTELRKLAKEHQVFCVTHLPQVAAQAKYHYWVEKSQTNNTTKVRISPIHKQELKRIEELARMLGDRSSNSAKEHAKELLGAVLC